MCSETKQGSSRTMVSPDMFIPGTYWIKMMYYVGYMRQQAWCQISPLSHHDGCFVLENGFTRLLAWPHSLQPFIDWKAPFNCCKCKHLCLSVNWACLQIHSHPAVLQKNQHLHRYGKSHNVGQSYRHVLWQLTILILQTCVLLSLYS